MAYEGLIPTVQRRYRETTSDAVRASYEELMREETCPDCNGRRLKPASLGVTVGGRDIMALTESEPGGRGRAF